METFEIKANVKSVNGLAPDAGRNVDVPQISASEIVDIVYPVGSLYWSKNSTSPAILFGGTWTQIKDKFILAAGDSYAVGATGGEAAHTLTTAEMPSHTHTASSNSTGAHTHNVLMNSASGTGVIQAWLCDKPRGTYQEGTDSAGAHSHTITVNNTGSGNAHNNMPPYVTYYCWERTA